MGEPSYQDVAHKNVKRKSKVRRNRNRGRAKAKVSERIRREKKS